ncbi:hypothetical protein HUA74_05570 [Myxococcus sp. CA051A]|uniref:Uncharacterized protein n=1 Tax=Myxococcus llanfairpwllgwyngyllgogerychwyrndrobwllllantysiliogogogochensis TaxID=2590453 RepID=A0A540WS62_9BACT|nr:MULTISPECIES: hypothetical protein [Myxococcus]NTX07487.1 hypothetical protein [Myxococcus sp. CA040A]NTX10848.1 hypothetical protein [Myxococcus sp. CA056]NTX37265.1 hypothetical protein [Myxococcus sp. CA033]NTX53625.1 hypothetical protein [Myxococcus sp. CA039A]NTX60121.1 hypothetical protein [Myxococcus sp. CA051A]
MSPFSNEGCEVSTGFLFSHPCGLPAGALCPRCGKSVCDAHLTTQQEALVCTGCAMLGDEDPEDDGSTTTDSDDASAYYDDYGYYGSGSSWARGSSKDPHDFTEADGESLRHEDDSSFEEDLGGS